MIALMMMVRLPGAAAFHRIAAAVMMWTGIAWLMLLLVGIEAETILIIGMRCHLALSCSGTLWHLEILSLARVFLFFFIIFSTFVAVWYWVWVYFFVDGTL